MICHISLGQTTSEEVNELKHHGREFLQNYDGYCLNGGTCLYLVDAEGPASIYREIYTEGVRCEKYMWWK